MAALPASGMAMPAPIGRMLAADAPRSLARHEVHVWHVPLAPAGLAPGEAEALLTEAERARASRFLHASDRWRFALGRLASRRLLGRYLGHPPESVLIEHGEHGKPCLQRRGLLGPDIQFNLSHSGDWIVAAFAHSVRVGVDIEQVRAELRDGLIEHCMAEGERIAWRALPQPLRAAAFYRCWTSKEALLKGVGVGLSSALRSIEVSIDPGRPARLLSAPAGLDPRQWQLHTLGAAAGYVATLAVASPAAVRILEITDVSWRDIGAA